MPTSEHLGISDAALTQRFIKWKAVSTDRQAMARCWSPSSWTINAPGRRRCRKPWSNAGILDSRESRHKLLEQLSRFPPARLAIACDPRRSPDRGSLALIAELARNASATRVWLPQAPPGEALDAERLGRLARGVAAAGLAVRRLRSVELAGEAVMTNPWKAPLKLAVVGHTNVGKTSCLRTLTRDVGFGEVSHRPSTTRHVEGARLSVDGEPLLDLFDTPGLEDAIALLDYLERLERPGERLDGPARLARFLEGGEARQRFEQEAKVLRQLLTCDAGLYVIDAREPVLAKYRDELEVLASCGKPLPVLNFVSSANHREPDWRERWRGWACTHWCVSTASRRRRMASGDCMKASRCCWKTPAPQLERLIADQQAQRLARQQSAARLRLPKC